ncbi:hypothetical protein Slala03_79710 [Streptomyces lavendulae subsp. lavendulae]|nr:hypothetical protein Slala03_79710 [Streptomyces lavendulae subsp. lavendulae]
MPGYAEPVRPARPVAVILGDGLADVQHDSPNHAGNFTAGRPSADILCGMSPTPSDPGAACSAAEVNDMIRALMASGGAGTAE